MPIRRCIAHEAVQADAGRVALERGPVVYCLEGVDHASRVHNIVLPEGQDWLPSIVTTCSAA